MTAHRSLLAVIGLLLAPAVAAAEPSAADRAAAQAAISSQIEAFRRDDAPAAYGLASDAIRAMFPNPDVFIAMVRRGYAPVYRPRTVVFGASTEDGEGVAQDVLITDSAGVDWIARYTLARSADGRWLITGCTLVRNENGAV